MIHGRQQVECIVVTWCIIGLFSILGWDVRWWVAVPVTLLNFYLWYVFVWFVQLILPPYDRAYRDICFEVEAYTNEDNPDYLKTRRWFAWWHYIFSNFKR